MSNKHLTPLFQKNIVGLAIFTLISFAFVCIGCYLIYTEWRAENVFTRTSCKILDTKLVESSRSEKNRTIPTFGTSFYLKYQAGEKIFTAWRFPKRDGNFSDDAKQQQEKLNQYHIGNEYPCWYDPKKPEVVFLEHGSYLGPLFFLAIASVLFFTGIISLMNPIKKL